MSIDIMIFKKYEKDVLYAVMHCSCCHRNIRWQEDF